MDVALRHGLVSGLLLMLVPTAASAQFEDKSCVHGGNAALKKLEIGTKLASIHCGSAGNFADWATSMLAAEGKPPAPAKRTPEEQASAVDRWTCMYSAERLMDQDPTTAWCEGVEGDGVGEVVLAVAYPDVKNYIWAGFGRSAKAFANNNRPRKVRLTLLKAREAVVGDRESVHKDVVVLGRSEVELKDVNDYQELPLPVVTFPKDDPDVIPGNTFVAIEILSVYPGAKYKDTCISELTPEPHAH
jgi:hypothetical protein